MNTIESQLKEQEERQSQPTTPSNYSKSFVMQEKASARATKDTDWCMVLALPQFDSKQQRPVNTCSQGDIQLEANLFILSPTTSRHVTLYTGVTQMVALRFSLIRRFFSPGVHK